MSGMSGMSSTRRSGRRAVDTEERAARDAVAAGVEAVFQVAVSKRKKGEEKQSVEAARRHARDAVTAGVAAVYQIADTRRDRFEANVEAASKKLLSSAKQASASSFTAAFALREDAAAAAAKVKEDAAAAAAQVKEDAETEAAGIRRVAREALDAEKVCDGEDVRVPDEHDQAGRGRPRVHHLPANPHLSARHLPRGRAMRILGFRVEGLGFRV